MKEIKHKLIYIAILLALFLNHSYGQSIKPITLNLEDLNEIKRDAHVKKKTIEAKRHLIKKSNQIIADKKLYSVTLNSNGPAGSNKNDYTSNSAYLWPNPNTKNGLPYIKIDGKRNTYSEKVSDKPMIDGLSNDILHLGLAYFYTQDEKYVKWASKLLNYFFVNPSTRMSPNFNFSQVNPGKKDSGGSIMEAVVLINLMDGVQFMRGSENFPPKLSNELNSWFKNFFVWIETSPKGRINATHTNNIGTYYTLLRSAIALFIGDEQLAKNIFRDEAFRRVTDQISSQGVLEKELKRSLPLGYVKYNLSAFRQLNEIGRKLGFDLMNYEGPRGESLQKAFNWLDQFRRGDVKWKYSDEKGISHFRRSQMKNGDETFYRFNVERFNNYLENLTYSSSR